MKNPKACGARRIVLDQVTTVGQVQLLARDQVQSGHVSVNGLDIIAADALNRPEHPHKYGVDVPPGAFTLWNLQPNAETVLTAELLDISIGREQTPVNGSGVLVSGAGDTGGRLQVSRLETSAVFADSKIPLGTADQITGGVFVAYGAHVNEVRNRGPVVTYGTNAMVLDNWGDVDWWIAEAEINSHGPSGIGFVNFGTIHILRVERTIETFGRGARGFNAYDGVMDTASLSAL